MDVHNQWHVIAQSDPVVVSADSDVHHPLEQISREETVVEVVCLLSFPLHEEGGLLFFSKLLPGEAVVGTLIDGSLQGEAAIFLESGELISYSYVVLGTSQESIK